MRIIVFDQFHVFKEKEIERLSSLGTKEILTLDYWFENEPVRGQYNFDRLLKYESMCHKFGIKLLVMGPIIPPLWAPKEWFLKNAAGLRNDFSNELAIEIKNLLKKINSGEKIGFSDVCPHETLRFFSYWNPDAEKYLRSYITKVQKVLKNAEHICSIGCVGECFFPLTSFYIGLKSLSPWWYDEYAEKSWKSSGMNRKEWLHKEFLRITRARLELYPTKWLQYLSMRHFPSGTSPEMVGNMAVAEAFEENKDGLSTIIFEGLLNSHKKKIAVEQSRKNKVFVGAEGCKNIIPNYLRAEKIGFEGLICNPCLPMRYEPIKEWQYFALKIALLMDKNGIKGICARTVAYVLLVYSNFLRLWELIINEVDRLIGLFKLGLKKNYPQIYYIFKRIKG